MAAAASTRRSWAWTCSACARECVPIRAESRCLCGHRLKQHGPPGHGDSAACGVAGCRCPCFNFIVAEGSWVLRCRCKHKSTEHQPVAPHGCDKAGCACAGFLSPWVCNCDHPWAAHEQRLVERQVLRVGDLVARADLECEVNRFDLLQRGKQCGDG